ncbi:unnamed protein product, partial [marine sediment metagenome]
MVIISLKQVDYLADLRTFFFTQQSDVLLNPVTARLN